MADNDFAPELALEPRSVGDAREAIEQTRERISATLDEIETRIDETRQEIRRRADVLRPVRERISAAPWRALAIGASAGLVLGLLTGSGGDADEEDEAERRARRARHERKAHPRGSGREHETTYGSARMHVHGRRYGSHARAGAREQGRASVQERIVNHLLDALAGAVSDGISSRIRGKMLH